MTDELFSEIEQAICELPDRSSPEDWPEAMLVTGPELRRILEAHLPPLCPNPKARHFA